LLGHNISRLCLRICVWEQGSALPREWHAECQLWLFFLTTSIIRLSTCSSSRIASPAILRRKTAARGQGVLRSGWSPRVIPIDSLIRESSIHMPSSGQCRWARRQPHYRGITY
jgi:hypothetical protein